MQTASRSRLCWLGIHSRRVFLFHAAGTQWSRVYCSRCQSDLIKAEHNTEELMKEFAQHVAKYGPQLTMSIHESSFPEWWGKETGPYWYTCPEGHQHLRSSEAEVAHANG